MFNQKDKYKQARLYNKTGLEILDEDVQFIKSNDIFYVAFDAEEFNNCAILDEYELGVVLGEGGFGKVVLAKHIINKKKVAIKFMDISDQCKSNYLLPQCTIGCLSLICLFSLCSDECKRGAKHLQGGSESEEAQAQEHY